MLRALEGAKAALGVGSYGLSATSLEDVFLVIAEGRGPGAPPPGAQAQAPLPGAQAQKAPAGAPPPASAGAASLPAAAAAAGDGPPAARSAGAAVHSGCSLWWRQYTALLAKRALCARQALGGGGLVAKRVLCALVFGWLVKRLPWSRWLARRSS